MSGRRPKLPKTFDLLNDFYVADDTGERRGNDTYGSRIGEEAHDQISMLSRRLQILQHYQESVREEDRYNDFAVSSPFIIEAGYVLYETPMSVLTLTDEVAVAVVDFFHREAAAGRPWKFLTIEYCRVFTEPLGRLLEGAKSSGLFSSYRMIFFHDIYDEADQSERILQQFCLGNPCLEELKWSSPQFPPAILGVLDEILHDDSCNIKRLELYSRLDYLVGDSIIDVLEGCQSIEQLRLGRDIDLDQGYRILNLVNTCPRLREVDLSAGDLTGGTFWGRLTPDQCSFDARKRLHRLCLPPFLVDRFWRPHETALVTSSDADINQLLQVFPALGDFGDEALSGASVVVFSLRTTQLLAFNYVGRAQLDQSLPPVLWKYVLERVVKGTRNGMLFLQRGDLTDQKQTLVLSCQASVLFSLLKQDPTVLTLEACRVQPLSTSLLSSRGLLL